MKILFFSGWLNGNCAYFNGYVGFVANIVGSDRI